MPVHAEIPFAKFHGLRNDFLVVHARRLPHSLFDLARAILDRHTGVGADGLILVLPPRKKRHDARLRFFNRDGSEAEMSGNGIRCAGAYLIGLKAKRGILRIETASGLKSVERVEEGQGKWIFRVGMGVPILEPAKIPFKAEGTATPVLGFLLRTHRGVLPVTVISVGNPHCTVFVADFAAIDWASLGREIETNEVFPHRTNVEFVKVLSREEIEARFWERGVGHTTSSGSGSCAAVVASVLNGHTTRQVRVRTQAGVLEVAWPEKGEISLTGPVERISRGTYFYRG
jgi:diaminopimelate epimerase